MKYYKEGVEFTLKEIKTAHSTISFTDPTILGYKELVEVRPEIKNPEYEELEFVGYKELPNGKMVASYAVKTNVTHSYDSTGAIIKHKHTKLKEIHEANDRLIEDAEYLRVKNTVNRLLDASSISRGYNSILSECSYATSKVFKAEAQQTVDWRDAVWAWVFENTKIFRDTLLFTDDFIEANIPQRGDYGNTRNNSSN